MIVEAHKPGNEPNGQRQSADYQSAEYLEQGESTVVGPSMRFYVGGRCAAMICVCASCRPLDMAVT